MWLVACVSGCWCTVLVCAQYSHMSVCINRSLLWVNGVIAAVQWIGWKSSCVQHYIDLLCVYVRVCACVCSLAVSGLYNRGPLIVIVVNRGCWSAAADWPFTLRLQPEVNLRGVCHQIRVKMMIQRSRPRFGKIMLCEKKQTNSLLPVRKVLKRRWNTPLFGSSLGQDVSCENIQIGEPSCSVETDQRPRWQKINQLEIEQNVSAEHRWVKSIISAWSGFHCLCLCVLYKCQIMLTECLLASRVKKQP